MPDKAGIKAQQRDQELRVQCDHAVGGKLEMVAGVVGDAREADEQPVLPTRIFDFRATST